MLALNKAVVSIISDSESDSLLDTPTSQLTTRIQE